MKDNVVSRGGVEYTTMIDYLAQSSVFEGLSKDFLTSLLPHCVNNTFRRGTYLFDQGKPADHLYILSEGQVMLSVKIRFPTRRSEREVDVGILNPFDVFGTSALTPLSTYGFFARAVSDGACIAIDGKHLTGLLATDKQPESTVIKLRVIALLEKMLENTFEILAYERATRPRQYNLLGS